MGWNDYYLERMLGVGGVIPRKESCVSKLLDAYHSSPMGNQERILKICKQLVMDYFLNEM